MMRAAKLIRELGRHQPAELALFLGAGASKSSGIPLASEMIAEWRSEVFDEDAPPEARGGDPKSWLAARAESYPWLGKPDEYSRLFERQYPTSSRRQKYLESKIEGIRAGWGYLYLANIIVQARRFTTVFTTNFDDLLSQALSSFVQHTATVCNADSEVDLISFLSDRAKIIKLNGDYLFVNLKNTVDELRELGERMALKFGELARQRGLVLIGYAGGDENVMSMIGRLLEDPRTFPHSIYWGLRPGEAPGPRVADLLGKHPDRVRTFECPDFDGFMADLHASLGLELPTAILHPHTTLEGQLTGLIGKAAGQAHAVIQGDCTRLRLQLGRPIEAELAFAQRDWAAAIELARKHVAASGPNVGALTVWGSAVGAQASESGRDDLFAQATAKLEEAIALDRAALAPRYALARLWTARKAIPEAIRAHEELLALVKDDAGLRGSLATLYVEACRYADAEREVRALLARETRTADDFAAMASIMGLTGRLSESAEQLQQAVVLAPRNAQLRFRLGQTYVAMQRLAEAEDELREAVRMSPDNPFVVISLADFLRQRERPGEALKLLEDCWARGSAEVQGRLAELYMQHGRLAEAEKEARAALAANPEDARLASILGLALLARDETIEAERWLRAARDLNPDRPQPRWWLAQLYAFLGRHAEAEAELQALHRDQPQLAANLRAIIGQILQRAEAERRMGRSFSWRHVMMPPPGPVAGGPPAPQAAPPAPADIWSLLGLRGQGPR
jgi:tetratricopeptide (TPR) repeat protein